MKVLYKRILYNRKTPKNNKKKNRHPHLIRTSKNIACPWPGVEMNDITSWNTISFHGGMAS